MKSYTRLILTEDKEKKMALQEIPQRIQYHFWDGGVFNGEDYALARDGLMAMGLIAMATAAVGKGYFNKMSDKSAYATLGAGALSFTSGASEQDGYIALVALGFIVASGIGFFQAIEEGRFYIHFDLSRLISDIFFRKH